jgi:D-hydroxyproline dehydrogenase subunit gamma
MPLDILVSIDGRSVRVPAGINVVAALAYASARPIRHSLSGEPRAAFCGMGVCFECRVRIGNEERLACLTQVAPGMEIHTDA